VITHLYETRVHWIGSTGAGWNAYDRAHTGSAAPSAQELQLTTGEPHGDPTLLNPEQLLVMAASSCQMLWFLHLAAKARIDVVEYVDEAWASMPEGEGLTEIRLRPRIVVAPQTSEQRVRKLVGTAHERCNVANSLRTPIAIEPRLELAA
jgi:organic hydroperoxide reductase OsmC/OhrA